MVKSNKSNKIKTEILLQGKDLEKYQPDFARSLLQEPEYEKAEAVKILEQFFGREEV